MNLLKHEDMCGSSLVRLQKGAYVGNGANQMITLKLINDVRDGTWRFQEEEGMNCYFLISLKSQIQQVTCRKFSVAFFFLITQNLKYKIRKWTKRIQAGP